MYSQENNKQYMKILNLATPLTEQAIKLAYREFVKKNHPDLYKNDKNKDLATEKFKKGTEAYNYLLEHWEDINKIHTTNQSDRTDSNTEHKQTYERDDSCFRAFSKETYRQETRQQPIQKYKEREPFIKFDDLYNEVFGTIRQEYKQYT